MTCFFQEEAWHAIQQECPFDLKLTSILDMPIRTDKRNLPHLIRVGQTSHELDNCLRHTCLHEAAISERSHAMICGLCGRRCGLCLLCGILLRGQRWDANSCKLWKNLDAQKKPTYAVARSYIIMKTYRPQACRKLLSLGTGSLRNTQSLLCSFRKAKV